MSIAAAGATGAPPATVAGGGVAASFDSAGGNASSAPVTAAPMAQIASVGVKRSAMGRTSLRRPGSRRW